MRYILTMLTAFVLASATQAQIWPNYPMPPAAGQPDYTSYNYNRAYNRFLSSPYSYRTFSSLSPSRGVEYFTPYGREGYFREPGYQHQRITPYAFESYGYVPGGSSYRATPWSFERQGVTGYPYGYVVPHGSPYLR